jgi:peptidyl-prolyl cis-trans isomerase SurA
MRAARLIYLLALSVIAFAVPADYLQAEITNRVVATVNSDIITLHELDTSIKRVTGLSPRDLRQRDEERYFELRRAVLNTMINEKIAQQEIARLEIKVTAKDIEESIEQVKRENNLTHEELIQGLKAEGITLEEYKERIKEEIQRYRLVNYEVKSKIVVTEEDVRRCYENHIDAYRTVCEVRLARIFLRVRSQDDAEEIARVRRLGSEILQGLRQGRDFLEMAKKYSQGPAASEGGDLGWVALNNLETRLRNTISKVSPGGYTDLNPAPSGFQIIKVLEEKEGGVKPLEEVRDAIRSKLYKEKVEKRYAAWIEELREKSFIKVIF